MAKALSRHTTTGRAFAAQLGLVEAHSPSYVLIAKVAGIEFFTVLESRNLVPP